MGGWKEAISPPSSAPSRQAEERMARMRPGWANKLPQVSGRRAARAAPDQQFSIYSILGR